MRYFIALMFLSACFVLGFAWRDIRQGKLPDSATMSAMVGGSGSKEPSVAPKVLFKTAYDNISKNYRREVDPKKLRYAAMRGLVSALGDPHSMFFEPRQAEDFTIETEGSLVGIGARLAEDPLGALAVIVFEDGPGFKSGLRKGDIITEVDGKSSAGMSVEDIVQTIRGKEGTMVRLKLLRASVKDPVNIIARRSQVILPTVETALVPGTSIGYMSVSSFSEITVGQFDEGLDKLTSLKAKGLIIDLRGNGGGLLGTATEMLSRFVEDKLVVKLKRGDRVLDEERTLIGLKRNLKFPVIVLVNSESASASEIFAGVMSDYKLATIVGEHTYGKMSVQNVYPLVDGSSAKVTIAKYFMPSGQDISRMMDEDGIFISGGLKPDVEVKFRVLDPVKGAPATIVPNDTQLVKAVEIIQSRL